MHANAFSTSLRYDSSGNLYAWDGLSVWEQSGGTGAFNNIGAVAAGNSADAGPISFSQDGQSLLLSNGAGGYLGGGCNGVFWTMPASGGTAAQVTGSGVPYTGDAVALPAASTIPGSSTKYIVNAGTSDYTSSSLSIFDASTGSNQVVIDNGPGATTSIAINPKNNSLYVGVGYGPDAGNIYSFTLSQIDSAYNSATPIDFLSGGTLFNPTATGSQSGAGMFFDNNGYLFSGGDGITVFRPDGTISYDQPAGAADGYYDTLTYDPANNEVLKVPYGSSTGTLYNAADFEAAIWTNPKGGTWGLGSNWSGRPLSTVGSAGVRRQHQRHGGRDVGRKSMGIRLAVRRRLGRQQLLDQCGKCRRVDLGHVHRNLDHGRQRHAYDLRADRAGRELGGQHVGRRFFATWQRQPGHRRISGAQPKRRRAVDPQWHGQLQRRHGSLRRDTVRDELQCHT